MRFSFNVLILLLFTVPLYSQRPLPAPEEIKSLIQSLDPGMSWPRQQKVIKNRLKDHGEITFPYIRRNTVTFLYFDRNKEEDAIDRVSLAWPGNRWSKGETFFEQIYDGPLHLVTLRLQPPYTSSYTLISHGRGTSEKIEDPLNPWILEEDRLIYYLPAPRQRGKVIKIPNVKPRTKEYPLESRHIWVYLPPEYRDHPGEKYPVMYMQDGRSVWNNGGWLVNGHADRLIHLGKIHPLIIVGIENSSKRSEEYGGFSYMYKVDIPAHGHKSTLKHKKKATARSKAYVEFVMEELIPMINQKFRTLTNREYTAIAGSSYGAGISLHIGLLHPEVFSMIGSLSGGNVPASWMRHSHPFNVFPYIIDKQLPAVPSQKVFLHCGDQDIFMPMTRLMHNRMLDRGWKEGSDLYYVEDPGAGHTKKVWAAQMPQMLEWFYGTQ